MEQVEINIEGVKIPVIKEGNKTYYPIKMTFKEVLKRKHKVKIKTKKEGLLKFFPIAYTNFLPTTYETKCIEERALIIVLRKTHIKRLTDEQILAQNKFHKYLNIEELSHIKPCAKDIEHYLNEHDEYVKDIINELIQKENVKSAQRCSSCNKHFPLHNCFFRPDSRKRYGYAEKCIKCSHKVPMYRHPNSELYKLALVSLETYFLCKNNDIEKLYSLYLNEKIKFIPTPLITHENAKIIVKMLVDKFTINKNDLNVKFLSDQYKFKPFSKFINTHQVHQVIYGEDYYMKPYLYPNFTFNNIDNVDKLMLFNIFSNYLIYKNLQKNNIFTLDYYTLIVESKILSMCKKFNISESKQFAVEYHEFKYAGYLFKERSKNYYKNENSILFDLKYLIEEDMKLKKDKIPLYLTRNTLQKKCRKLYYEIVTRRKESIYYYINTIYPNYFTEQDFNINAYREEFDSDTECFINELLKKEFSNVLYNPKASEHTIKLLNKVPDWFVFTPKGVILVEYFGMYDLNHRGSSRIEDYIEKTRKKLKLYEQLKGYHFLYLFIEDTENGYRGVKNKIEELKKTLDI